ncbi:MAG: thiamine-phosphate kinase [Candidatus Omnitrophota bacterium]
MKELKFIEYIKQRASKPGKGIIAGIGDDAAVLEYDDRQYLLWATDMIVEGTHFMLKNDSLENIGRKVVAVNISDIAAMGGVPKYITVNIGVPRGFTKKKLIRIYDGIFNMCRRYGVFVVGGDTNGSERLVIDVSILGVVEKKRLIRRNGAKKGDLILITGPVRDGKKEHLTFDPRVKEAQFLSGNFKITSMIDVSDGIAVDLNRLCAESKTGAIIYQDAISLSANLSLEDALYYGESFELLFTMVPSEVKKLFLSPEKHKAGYCVIGEITGKKEGCILVRKEGRIVSLKALGYRHM